jgi:hypothetical protein
MKPCPICKQYPMKHSPMADGSEAIECPRCGLYRVAPGAVVSLIIETELNPRQRTNFSSWLFENRGYVITVEKFGSLISNKAPSFHSRADKLLLTIEKETEYVGQYLEAKPTWFASSWSIDENEFSEIVNYLVSAGQIEPQTPGKGNSCFKIAPPGWRRLEELKELNPGSNQCFVAMWFDDEMKRIYESAFAKAISDAGYKPHRVDQREYTDKIDDEIIAQIRSSRFIVADFTGQRAGVYYEAGFAKGLGLEVIWTCKKDEIPKLHFDIRQYNCIDWEADQLPELVKRLKNRIESIFGHGPYSP